MTHLPAKLQKFHFCFLNYILLILFLIFADNQCCVLVYLYIEDFDPLLSAVPQSRAKDGHKRPQLLSLLPVSLVRAP